MHSLVQLHVHKAVWVGEEYSFVGNCAFHVIIMLSPGALGEQGMLLGGLSAAGWMIDTYIPVPELFCFIKALEGHKFHCLVLLPRKQVFFIRPQCDAVALRLK